MNNNFGIAYDCILFGTIYFNDEFLHNDQILDEDGIIVDPFEIYNEALAYNVCPAAELAPFFFRDVRTALIAGYFYENMSFCTDDIQVLIKHIQNERKFLKYIISYKLNTDNDKIIDKLYENRHNISFLKMYELEDELLDIISNIKELTKLLTDFLFQIHSVISDLNVKYSDHINHSVESIKESIEDGKIYKYLTTDFEFDKFIANVTLLHKYTFDCSVSNYLKILVGTEALYYQYIVNKYKNISIENFLKLISNKMSFEVYQLFKNSDTALRIDDIAIATNFSKNTIRGIVDKLKAEQIICLERVTKQAEYFKFNQEYIRYASPQIYKFLDSCLENPLN